MTNKEAILWIEKIIKKYIHGGDDGFDAERKEALQMGISALEQELLILKCETFLKTDELDYLQKKFLRQKEEGVVMLPPYIEAIKPSKNQGEWLDVTVLGEKHSTYQCSECGGYSLSRKGQYKTYLSPYCPHCGAKMD